MDRPRPILLGYQRVRESSPDQAENDLRVLRAFAEREGYALGPVYTSIAGDLGAFERLIAGARDGEGAAVGVSSEADLGGTARERFQLRSQLKAAGIPLLVAQVL